MSRRRLGTGVPRFDHDHTLYVLRDNLRKADAFITAAEDLIERRGVLGRFDEDGDDNLRRRRNHVAHLIESAKMAVRAAIYAGDELDRPRQEA